MTTGSIKIIRRPPPATVQFANIQKEIVNQLQAVGRQHVNERKAIVADFDTSIKFGYRIAATEKQVTLSIVVENSESTLEDSDWTVGELWRALDRTGTRSHGIQPKRAQRLAFQTNYQPHTRPIARYGGPGRATGPVVFARRVNHPGFPPRQFSDSIGKRLKRQFEQAIDRGVRIGSKKR